ncbi:MAG: hypothetical protein ABFE01_11410, partial [Phycisphaerales bacterium]
QDGSWYPRGLLVVSPSEVERVVSALHKGLKIANDSRMVVHPKPDMVSAGEVAGRIVDGLEVAW